MKPRELPVKRQPLKRGLFRTLHAKIKRPAATAAANPAELDGDIPRMNVGRVLIVIALVHVIGIAGFFAQRYFEHRNLTQDPGGPTPSQKPLAAGAATVSTERPSYGSTALASMTDLPKIQPGDLRHPVQAGDTYLSIARKYNISEASLRAANGNVDLFSGFVARVPPREIVAMEPAEMQRLRDGGKPDAPSPRAIRVTPNINLDTAPRATPVIEENTSTGKTYTVRKGDTFYHIARAHKISVDLLMSSNGIKNDKSLKIGQVLRIPTQQH
jgi:LysM repeat protein